MKFEIGEILNRAFQIARKYKILWLFSVLPAAVSFRILPVMVLVQESAITFLKSADVHVYLRLTRSFVAPILDEAKA